MKTFLLAIALTVLWSVPLYSQAFSVGLGADVNFPLDEFKNKVETGYGATALARLSMLDMLDLTGGVEYLKFTDKSVTVNSVSGDGSSTAWGVLIGGRLHLLPAAYVGLETGAYSYTTTLPGFEEVISHGILVPSAGFMLSNLDLSARYVPAGDEAFWGLRAMIWL